MSIEDFSTIAAVRGACRASCAVTLIVQLQYVALVLAPVAGACFASVIFGWPVVWPYATGLVLTLSSTILFVVAIAFIAGAVTRQVLEINATEECLGVLLHEDAHRALKLIQDKRLSVPWLIQDPCFVYLVGYMYVSTGVLEEGKNLMMHARSMLPELPLLCAKNQSENTPEVFNIVSSRLRVLPDLHWPIAALLRGMTFTAMGVLIKLLIGLLVLAYVIRWCCALW